MSRHYTYALLRVEGDKNVAEALGQWDEQGWALLTHETQFADQQKIIVPLDERLHGKHDIHVFLFRKAVHRREP